MVETQGPDGVRPEVGAPPLTRLHATLMRGGTSKCWVFRAADLPTDREARDLLLVRIFGSPDPRQIDGVGGATSTTSKALIVDGYSEDSGSVEYEFAQISIDRPRVEWESNCGNCATGLGLYAVQAGLVPPAGTTTQVQLLNTATGLHLDVEVETPGGRPAFNGRTYVPGATYPGVQVSLRFAPPSWSTYGATLPTGNPVDVFHIDGRDVRVSLVDAGAPAALVLASDLGLGALAASSADVDAWLPFLVRLRQMVAERMGIPNADGALQSIPKVGLVGPPRSGGGTDFEARMVSMTAAHPSIGITSSVAVGAAACVPGTTVALSMAEPVGATMSIGTMAGPVAMGIERTASGEPAGVSCIRSARRIADAEVHVPADWRQSPVGPASSQGYDHSGVAQA